VTVSANATDNVGVVGVQFKLDGANLGTEDTTAPYSVSWNTTTAANGAHTLTAVARDAAGNTTTSALVTMTVSNPDLTRPTLTITSPTSNATYSTTSSSLTLGGTATDNVGVTQVTWANSRGGSGTASGATSWTASGIVLRLGTNGLTVTARDAAGNTATAIVTVTLSSTLTFTDDPLVAQSTTVKAVHIAELRAAIDAVRVASGLATFAWTDPTLTPESTPLKAVHVTDLRTALSQAYVAAGQTPPTYTDPTGLTVTKAIHLNELRTAVRMGQSPDKVGPFVVPGLIQAEDFANGAEGVAYHDLTPGNQGGQYRLDVGVDIISNPNGYAVNNFETGEWLTYTINVTQSGTYRIEALVSSQFDTSRWHIEIDGVNVTGSILVPNTGSWWTFQWVGKSGVTLTAGQHALRVFAEQQYFNLDAIRTVAEVVP
jgi:hypothetical protein